MTITLSSGLAFSKLSSCKQMFNFKILNCFQHLRTERQEHLLAVRSTNKSSEIYAAVDTFFWINGRLNKPLTCDEWNFQRVLTSSGHCLDYFTCDGQIRGTAYVLLRDEDPVAGEQLTLLSSLQDRDGTARGLGEDRRSAGRPAVVSGTLTNHGLNIQSQQNCSHSWSRLTLWSRALPK
jgi:hypothetical protein